MSRFDDVPIEAYEGVYFDDEERHCEVEIEHGVPAPEPRKEYVRKAPEITKDASFVQPFTELPESAKDTAIGRLAGIVSRKLEFPEASTFMALMASASAAVACAYATQYRTHTAVALGMYVIIEQPPATKKSYLLSIGADPYAKAIGVHNKRIAAKNIEFKERDKKEWAMRFAFGMTTDATSAALDRGLHHCSEGRFVVSSAEQSALTSLFPEAGTYSSNNELILKGFAGEYVNGMRGGREAYAGVVQGSIALIAQAGSCRRVIQASNGTGMAERFYFMAEPTLLGGRELKGEYPSHAEVAPFEDACRKCVELYSDRIMSQADLEPSKRLVLEPSELNKVRPAASGYNLIIEKIRSQEGKLGALNATGENIACGWLGKYETHVLKVAGVIHVIESLSAGCYPGEIIPDSVVMTAMDIVDMLADQLTEILHDAGESGSEAEADAIVEILSNKPLSKREALLKAKNRKPFRGMGRNAYAAAAARLERMISEGALLVNQRGKLEVV